MTASFPNGPRLILPVAFATALTALGIGLGVPTGLPTGSNPAAAQASSPAAAQAANPEFMAANVCIGCHTPASGPLLSGMQLGRWLGPNITPDRVSGIGAWSRDDVVRYLRHGNAPGRGQAGGPMAPIVEALQDKPDADLHALVDWLARQPAHRDPIDQVPASEHGGKLAVDPAPLRPGMPGNPDQAPSGAALYNIACASCHGADGAGSPNGHFPSMFHNSAVGRRTNLVAVLLDGVERHVRGGTVFMQSFDGAKGVVGGLSDGELAELVNFVVKQFGDPALATVRPEDIQRSRLEWWGEGKPTAAQGQLIVVGGGPGGAAVTCFGCHGLQGQGDAGAGFPRLAGLDPTYFAKQMADYASGARPNGAMSPIAQQLSAADNHSLALYYAGLAPQMPVVPLGATDRQLVEAGKALYDRGAPERGVQACADCHALGGGGFNPVYPSVVQPSAYNEGQMRDWQAGRRRNDPHDLMGRVARRMTDEDIRAVSAYLAGLVP
jgi:cytochrome c553